MNMDLPTHADSATVAQLLDEHHLVVTGEPADRRAFAAQLREHLEALEDTEVLLISGSSIRDLASFAEALTQGLDLDETPTDVDGVIAGLREYPHEPKHLFVMWEDADVMLDADAELFGKLAQAFIGTAAERELISPDMLVLQRMVFLGGETLGAFAGDPNRQLRTWSGTHSDDQTFIGDASAMRDPFWEVAACLEHPPVLVYRLDGLS
jgi:hypothetical protein